MLNSAVHTGVDLKILKTLLYFDIFSYPLNDQEIYRFLSCEGVTFTEVVTSLEELTREKYIFQFQELYSVQNNEAIISRRLRGNQEALKCLPLARKQAKLISKFPFVRAVLASGSLSKGYMDNNSDLDFFVICERNRIWISRMLLALYKRIFLFNSHKNFCINYYVDTGHLEIDEKNIFTATELATLIPLSNAKMYFELLAANKWLLDMFPNFKSRDISQSADVSQPQYIKMAEKILNSVGDQLNESLRKVTLNRWKRLYYSTHEKKEFDIAFKSTAGVSKNHPRNFQQKVLSAYRDKLWEYGEQHKLPLV
jgi:hypothetical protein